MYTFNIERQHSAITESIFQKIGVSFIQMDVFEKRQDLFDLFDRPTFLLCDGGNKADELIMCCSELPIGSIVAVHDYGTEFLDKHWEVVSDYVQPIWEEEWTKEDCRTALFKIK